METLLAAGTVLVAAIIGRLALDVRRRRAMRAPAAALPAAAGADIAEALSANAEAAWGLPADVRARLEAAAASLEQRATESERREAERAESLRSAIDGLAKRLDDGVAFMTAASDALHRRLNERVAVFERQILGAVDAARAGEDEVRREVGEMRAALASRAEAERVQLDALAGRTVAGLDALAARLTEVRASVEGSTGDQLAELRNSIDQQVRGLDGRNADELRQIRDDVLGQLRAVGHDLSQQAAQLEAGQRDGSSAVQQQLNRSMDVTRASVDGIRKEIREIQGAIAVRLKAAQEITSQQVSGAVEAALEGSAARLEQNQREQREELDATRARIEAAQSETLAELRLARDRVDGTRASIEAVLEGRLNAVSDRLGTGLQELASEWKQADATLAGRLDAEAHGRAADAEAVRTTLDALSGRITAWRNDAATEIRSIADEIGRGAEASRAEAQALVRSLPEVVNAMVERLDAEREKQAQDLKGRIESLHAVLTEKAEALSARSADDLRRAVSELHAAVDARMDAEGSERAASTHTIRAALDSLAARAVELEQEQRARFEELSHSLADGLDTLATRTAEARADVAASTAERLTALRTALEGRLASVYAQTDADVARLRDDIREASETVARSAAGQADRLELIPARIEELTHALEATRSDESNADLAGLTERIGATGREISELRTDLLTQVLAAREALERTAALQRAEHERSAALEQQVSSSSDIVRTSGEIIHALRSAFDTLLTRVAELERLQRDTLNDMREIRRQRPSYWDRQH